MAVLVGDTSGVVSLGVAAGEPADPLDLCLDAYDVVIPEVVRDELEELTSYDDAHATGAAAVLARTDSLEIRSVDLDSEFPLDAGENAAVTLANDLDAGLLLCDEFNRLGLIHASLADSRLVTTPPLLSVFVRQGRLGADEALEILDPISDARSWEANSYVQRARTRLSNS